jgi:response regulator RpfG family c-di-GMP phosphodiesterase
MKPYKIRAKIMKSKSIKTDLDSINSIKGIVLIIDDEDINHHVIRMILKNAKYDIISTYSGEEALDYLSKHSSEIDFIFLDLMMPNMHGLEVLKKIKFDKSLANIPVIVQSASDNKNDYSKAIEFGAIKFFIKPTNHKDIIDFIKSNFK